MLKQHKYPINHPKIINNNFDYTLTSYFGFVKCIVKPPKRLYIGVLPLRVDDKLLFPLCFTCATTCQQTSRQHKDKDRQLVGTWTSVELLEAVRQGYDVVLIIQVLQYEIPEVNIFDKYINMFLKIKQQSSGWPANCETEDQKIDYVSNYLAHEGIELDPNEIRKNSGLRSISKLLLNSLWGKLSQRINQTTTELITDVDSYLAIIENPNKQIKGEVQVSENCLLVSWQFIDPHEARRSNTNLAVASFVTSYARLRLLKLINRIEEIRPYSVLYFDTDSVIYLKHKDDECIQTGYYLGDLTSEIPSDKKCNLFVSLGPKSYGYQLIDGNGVIESIIKIKGLKLHAAALDVINIKELSDMAQFYVDGNGYFQMVPQMIIRSNDRHEIYTNYFHKMFRPTSNKRIISSALTLPFGYV